MTSDEPELIKSGPRMKRTIHVPHEREIPSPVGEMREALFFRCETISFRLNSDHLPKLLFPRRPR